MTGQVTESSTLTHVSAALFGRSIRLPVAAWIRQRDTPFFQKQCAQGVGAMPQYVGKELTGLAELGMIQQLPREAGDTRIFYRQVPDNPLWAVIDAATTAVERYDAGTE
jgi:hypothetical protein